MQALCGPDLVSGINQASRGIIHVLARVKFFWVAWQFGGWDSLVIYFLHGDIVIKGGCYRRLSLVLWPRDVYSFSFIFFSYQVQNGLRRSHLKFPN